MSNARQRELIREFLAVTSATSAAAETYLERNHWSLDHALDDFYTQSGGGGRAEQYSAELVATFERYAAGGAMDTEALVRYVGDLGFQLEDVATLCLARLLKVEELTADISRFQFLSTWHGLGCSSLPDMRAAVDALELRLRTDAAYFRALYAYTFGLGLDAGGRRLSVETAIAYWSLFFLDHTYAVTVPAPRLRSWFEFLRAGDHSVSRDTWDMFPRFAQRFPDDTELLEHYNELASWPLVIDEYYEWVKGRNQL
ncbi:AGL194Cp [Eremothecium gossypii ATCC 10895]|uniref:Defective in cullin neddylation protein 1 n=1 Tax=Eremothecium gossypii (strain ATCC 10895 / CBS 109.51 / FGSC 9923 / NRRL Y-1056) TaxID=284811 RepID=DCN1_EREGS|nr:AGL194Cp [Eremothecium gossypii ATCC 10895]Q750Y3.2 RecName: Full=Defective in cullin neddylation protein 1 [Eremothecium gossypii ATCC 10895]AAS54297.2 AGL194Cp [Eremothecium gossypii ATCC 10895]AEY98623.1 FAGL194Cp [Eremothecium gossypii FDAG1]